MYAEAYGQIGSPAHDAPGDSRQESARARTAVLWESSSIRMGAGLVAFYRGELVFAGVTDTCGMAMLLAQLPWN